MVEEATASPAGEQEASAPVLDATSHEAAPANPDVQAAPDTTAPENPEPKQPNPRLQARFSELTTRAKTAEQEAAYWREQALARQQPAQPSGYDYDDALSYDGGQQPDIEQTVLSVLQKHAAQQAEQRAETERAQKIETLRTKFFESGLEGAQLVASGAVPVSVPMAEALAVSEAAPQLANYLGLNPHEAARIAAQPPHLQGYELARLEQRLASQPRLTSAPPPPPTVGARAVASDDPRNMSMEQYKAARESGRL